MTPDLIKLRESAGKATPGIWVAMGSQRLPRFEVCLEGNAFFMKEISPGKLYDRHGKECKETDWQFFSLTQSSI